MFKLVTICSPIGFTKKLIHIKNITYRTFNMKNIMYILAITFDKCEKRNHIYWTCFILFPASCCCNVVQYQICYLSPNVFTQPSPATQFNQKQRIVSCKHCTTTTGHHFIHAAVENMLFHLGNQEFAALTACGTSLHTYSVI